MQLLGTDAYRTALSESITSSCDTVSLVSAYMTVEGVDWFLERLPGNVECRSLSRWNCSDIMSGGSDLAVYERLKSRGYDFYVLPDLHAKAIVIDRNQLFLGSANITNSGLKLVPGGNRELGSVFSPEAQDLVLIDILFQESVLIDQHIYDLLCNETQKLNDIEIRPPLSRKWSNDLLNKLTKPPQRLWVAEMFWCNSPKELLGTGGQPSSDVVHDLTLMGLPIQSDISESVLRARFLESRFWLWLNQKLRCAQNKEMYYGQLSAELHSAFADDPKPYRKDVKGLLSNLLMWSSILGRDFIAVDRPSHSERIRLKI